MVIEGYKYGKTVALVTEKGQIYIHELQENPKEHGPVYNPSEMSVYVFNCVSLQELLASDTNIKPSELSKAISGAIRTLLAEDYDSVDG